MGRKAAGLILIIAWLLLALSPLGAEEDPSPFRIYGETFVSRGFGMSDYFLEATDGSGNGVQSLLEFPLDSFYAGGKVILEAKESAWSVGLSGAINLTDPASLMTDRDWDLYPGVPPVIWSYTESNLDYFSLDLRLIGDRRFYSRGNLELLLTGGYRYFWIDQHMTDYSGWQYSDQSGPLTLYQIESNQDAIDYAIHYQILHAGLALRTEISERIRLSLHAAPALGFFFDRDDHILRTKLSTGRGLGYGVKAGLDLELLLRDGSRSRRNAPYLRLFGEYGYFFSPGVQTQEWYGNADPRASKGDKYTGIVHDVTLKEQRVGIAFGIRYALE